MTHLEGPIISAMQKTDGIAEFSHKNGIYSTTWNVTEYVKFLMNK